jgi:hypothetical protein
MNLFNYLKSNQIKTDIQKIYSYKHGRHIPRKGEERKTTNLHLFSTSSKQLEDKVSIPTHTRTFVDPNFALAKHWTFSPTILTCIPGLQYI